jgi:hypothetical protein
MTSVGLYSGSISDINLQTVSVVSTSSTGSWIPDKRIRFILPYCSRLSKSFLSCRLTFQDHTFSPWEAEFLNLSFVVCHFDSASVIFFISSSEILTVWLIEDWIISSSLHYVTPSSIFFPFQSILTAFKIA